MNTSTDSGVPAKNAMSTPGARHLAESGIWLADQNAPASVITLEPEPEIEPAVAPLFEIAAAHDGQPPFAWLHMFRSMFVEQ